MDHTVKNETLFPEDVRSTEELIAQALAKDADADDEIYWGLIRLLQMRVPAIFETLKALAAREEPKSRALAATVLGQSGLKEKALAKECVGFLAAMLLGEKDSTVLVSIIFALGHHHDNAALKYLLKFENCPSADVRHALAVALCGFQEEAALEALCRLSSDPDQGVRSWATFGIGTLSDKRRALILDALVDRLADDDDEVRGEALVGLAERCELCVARALHKELDRHSPEELREWALIQDAAAAVEKCHAASPQQEWEELLTRLQKVGIPLEQKHDEGKPISTPYRVEADR